MEPSKNEGIIMSGGKIEAGKLAVGKGARVEGDSAPVQEEKAEETPNRDVTVAEQTQLSHLRRLLIDHFDDSELRDLCFEVSVDYDGLSGDNKRSKARELLLYLWRSGRLDDLTSIGGQMRPELTWQRPGS